MKVRPIRRAPFPAFPVLGMLLTALMLIPAASAWAQASRDAPLTPAPVIAKQTGSGEITVTWKAVPDATGYIIGREVGPSGLKRFRPNYPPENTLVDKELTVGLAHRYSVVAILPNDRVSRRALSNPITPTEATPKENADPMPDTGGTSGAGGIGTPGGSAEKTSGGSAKTAAPRARFRVTIAGFKVLRETDDNPTQIDGQRDEVFITVNVTDMASSPKGPVNRSFRTRTYGDTNNFPARIKAGTSNSKGGLRSGDTYIPARTTSRVGASVFSTTTDRLPLRIFDGELVQGGPASVIMPILWEEDLERSALNEWDSVVSSPDWAPLVRLVPVVGNTGYRILRLVEMMKPLATQVPGLAVIASVFNRFDRATMDRPIGLEVANSKRVFNPRVISLTYELADQLVRERGKGNRARMEIPFEDGANTGLGGRYVLYIDLERVP